MAIQASTQWRIRADGDVANGGGYDPGIVGAGTDYTDQSSAQLALSDLATSGAASTTLTSATGGFTAAMIGNCIRITSGTNFTAGYYFVTGHTDANTVTLDRTPTPSGAGSGGVGKLGGAFSNFTNFADGGTRAYTSSPATPLAAGHTIYLRGAGNDDPSSADYDYTGANQYWTMPDGDVTGQISVVGYNGRPFIKSNYLLFYNTLYWHWTNVKVAYGTSGYLGGVFVGRHCFHDCIFDQNNNDFLIAASIWQFTNNVVRCTGNTGGGSQPVIQVATYHALVENCRITSKGVGLDATNMASVLNNIIYNCGSDGITSAGTQDSYAENIQGNRIHNCSGSGIRLVSNAACFRTRCRYNVLTKNGGYGINFVDGSSNQNNRRQRGVTDYNAFGAGSYANSSGPYANYPGGSNDVILSSDVSPYVNEGSGDFNINDTVGGGALLRAVQIEIPAA